MEKRLTRRALLRFGAFLGLGAGLPAAGGAREAVQLTTALEKNPDTLVRVRLGRTGLMISEVSFGSSRLRSGDERLVSHALERGVNYFDTAESYTGGSSEEVLGKALKGQRDKVYIATKMSAGASTSVGSMMQSLEESLKRLQTDYVDVFFNHAVNDVDRLKNDEWSKFVDTAKAQGKIRFTGMSGHAGRLADCLDYGLDQDLFDVVLVATNFGEDPAFYETFTSGFDFVARQPRLPVLLKKAREKDVGVIAMKVLRGAKLNDMKPFEREGDSFAQAALRWILNHENIDAAIISMTDEALIDEYLAASSLQKLTKSDMRLLKTYSNITDASYCRPACDDCEGSCPRGVRIADVLRTRMYALDYGDPVFGKTEYSSLASDARSCVSCRTQECRNACTYQLPIASLCTSTHKLLA